MSLTVTYKGFDAGEYHTDILVDNILMLELKCADALAREHTAQCLKYLRASGLPVCLLLNFEAPKVEWKRLVNSF